MMLAHPQEPLVLSLREIPWLLGPKSRRDEPLSHICREHAEVMEEQEEALRRLRLAAPGGGREGLPIHPRLKALQILKSHCVHRADTYPFQILGKLLQIPRVLHTRPLSQIPGRHVHRLEQSDCVANGLNVRCRHVQLGGIE